MRTQLVDGLFADLLQVVRILTCVGTSSANTTCTFLHVYQDAFAWLATVCDNKSVASCQRTCCKLINLTGSLQLVFKSCNKSTNETS